MKKTAPSNVKKTAPSAWKSPKIRKKSAKTDTGNIRGRLGNKKEHSGTSPKAFPETKDQRKFQKATRFIYRKVYKLTYKF